MGVNVGQALELVKTRLNRLQTDQTLDSYFEARITAAAQELEGTGIRLDPDSTEDLLLVVDYAVWQYQSRDSQTGMPDWLRLRRRERWVRQGVRTDDS